MDNDQLIRVRLLHAEQDHLTAIEIAKAVSLPPHIVKLIMDGHPFDDVTAEQVADVKNALLDATTGTTLGDVARQTDVPVVVVNAINDGVYDLLLPPGWDLI